jgi:uncharacterized protein with PQ loop repeat
MNDESFMYAATVLYFICYAPSVYADYKNKNANIYNLPEKLVSLCATTLGLIYSIRIDNTPLIVNYGPHLVMEIITLLFKLQYIYQNWSNKDKIYISCNDNIYDVHETDIVTPIHMHELPV